ncbi:hypothetical protein A2870_00295 [Candidatus Curtissbacteria bacterium RIFCSPHIGHO2_01_FULL_41_11]|uniref:Uncharacterized protein n=1 Tax=Candidatus Curtissbacteria bacterium RIFCSPHIGHO2_01_FULL_41_11 TaxID=1797711 RepID=A0A1F5G4V1_9BACT|nr:MAG: hypothetical protein A2870_00295 [Candidatus Curtissbacteria bacterium RIFCSPHIGHO2_01_FULL_41_11]
MTENAPLGDIVLPDASNREDLLRQANIRRLGEQFRDTLVASQRFAWFGIFETEDELGRTRRVFMLAEREEPGVSSGHRSLAGDFAEFSVAARPDVFFDMYYLHQKDPVSPTDIAHQAVAETYSTAEHQAKVEKLYEEQLV